MLKPSALHVMQRSHNPKNQFNFARSPPDSSNKSHGPYARSEAPLSSRFTLIDLAYIGRPCVRSAITGDPRRSPDPKCFPSAGEREETGSDRVSGCGVRICGGIVKIFKYKFYDRGFHH